MCRSIKVLRRRDVVTTPEETQAAALQYVRKISGFRKPSQANQAAFDRAVAEIAEASAQLLDTLAEKTKAPRSADASIRPEPGR